MQTQSNVGSACPWEHGGLANVVERDAGVAIGGSVRRSGDCGSVLRRGRADWPGWVRTAQVETVRGARIRAHGRAQESPLHC